jgi:hypothetical protein
LNIAGNNISKIENYFVLFEFRMVARVDCNLWQCILLCKQCLRHWRGTCIVWPVADDFNESKGSLHFANACILFYLYKTSKYLSASFCSNVYYIMQVNKASECKSEDVKCASRLDVQCKSIKMQRTLSSSFSGCPFPTLGAGPSDPGAPGRVLNWLHRRASRASSGFCDRQHVL